MRKKFPFLQDPTSQEYIQAQAAAEATWCQTKGDLYDPILSIRVEHLPDLDSSDLDLSDLDLSDLDSSDLDW